tara:strand:- start:13859 stop:14059 length:201 start_codon:yes stop_codon:yes gene_type:complete
MRDDQLSDVQKASAEKIGKSFFTEGELVAMNCLARLEVLKGNKDLNLKMVQVTEDLAHIEVKAKIK